VGLINFLRKRNFVTSDLLWRCRKISWRCKKNASSILH